MSDGTGVVSVEGEGVAEGLDGGDDGWRTCGEGDVAVGVLEAVAAGGVGVDGPIGWVAAGGPADPPGCFVGTTLAFGLGAGLVVVTGALTASPHSVFG